MLWQVPVITQYVYCVRRLVVAFRLCEEPTSLLITKMSIQSEAHLLALV